MEPACVGSDWKRVFSCVRENNSFLSWSRFVYFDEVCGEEWWCDWEAMCVFDRQSGLIRELRLETEDYLLLAYEVVAVSVDSQGERFVLVEAGYLQSKGPTTAPKRDQEFLVRFDVDRKRLSRVACLPPDAFRRRTFSRDGRWFVVERPLVEDTARPDPSVKPGLEFRRYRLCPETLTWTLCDGISFPRDCMISSRICLIGDEGTVWCTLAEGLISSNERICRWLVGAASVEEIALAPRLAELRFNCHVFSLFPGSGLDVRIVYDRPEDESLSVASFPSRPRNEGTWYAETFVCLNGRSPRRVSRLPFERTHSQPKKDRLFPDLLEFSSHPTLPSHKPNGWPKGYVTAGRSKISYVMRTPDGHDRYELDVHRRSGSLRNRCVWSVVRETPTADQFDDLLAFLPDDSCRFLARGFRDWSRVFQFDETS